MANSPEAREPDGTLKDVAPPPVETKPDETKPADTKPSVPEAYTFTPPEGAKLDDAAIAAATPIFKELGLSQDQANKLMDVYTKLAGDKQKSSVDTVLKMREDWRNEAKADKDIGPLLDTKVKQEIGKALAQIKPATAEAFKTAMDITGAGDHPAFIKAFFEMAQKLNEGSHITGEGPSKHGQTAPGQSSRPSLAQAMYPGLA